MRFSPRQELTAADIVNTYSEEDLADLLWRYGEERRSRPIARRLCEERPFRTTTQLAKAVEQAVGRRARGVIHPATRTFQALRIAVNQELLHLETALLQAHGLLGFGSRLVVISYHSLEDRIVKNFLRRESQDCVCPPGVPVCVCGHRATLRLVARSVVRPSAAEVAANPRARSARLRVAERLPSAAV
jgi:16S rRNA (cytosine1402-N4)-methyltransferase